MDFYKVYTECVNGYSAAIMTLTACESSKKFCRFMEVRRGQRSGQVLPANSYSWYPGVQSERHGDGWPRLSSVLLDSTGATSAPICIITSGT